MLMLSETPTLPNEKRQFNLNNSVFCNAVKLYDPAACLQWSKIAIIFNSLKSCHVEWEQIDLNPIISFRIAVWMLHHSVILGTNNQKSLSRFCKLIRPILMPFSMAVPNSWNTLATLSYLQPSNARTNVLTPFSVIQKDDVPKQK